MRNFILTIKLKISNSYSSWCFKTYGGYTPPYTGYIKEYGWDYRRL